MIETKIYLLRLLAEEIVEKSSKTIRHIDNFVNDNIDCKMSALRNDYRILFNKEKFDKVQSILNRRINNKMKLKLKYDRIPLDYSSYKIYCELRNENENI